MKREDIEEKIREEVKKIENERVVKIYLDEQNGEKRLVIDLDSGAKEFSILTDKTYPLNLTESAISRLDEIVTKQQTNLVICADSYSRSGRTFYFFLYDLVSLSWFLDKLPSKFNKLKKIKPNDDELLHNRIHAQLAVQYQDLGYELGFEKPNSTGRVPDLHIDSKDVEIKTIINPILTEKEYIDFSLSFRNSHDTAIKQIDAGGMVVIGIWSQRVNNVLKAYFRGMYNAKTPEVQSDITVLVLEGNKVFEDYYMTVTSHLAKDCIRGFAESGYKRIDPMEYMRNMTRAGFPHGRQQAPDSGMMYVHKMS